ncbi:MAG: hypothetical protein CBC55_02550 [Gammaproteobacteria bacterium TMED95]|nr:MAG: hypothetical protein CBC55_02550 [Gammaproteobacteria bacterium TMED95]|tara:strand:+ start:1585 stop:1881 length:297 start_codon:yes stop_codon:yes gene_type:complete
MDMHKSNLKVQAIRNKVASLSHLSFHAPKIIEMCESASRDCVNNIVAPNAHTDHPMYDAELSDIQNATLNEQLEYLMVHGFTGEAIYSQAGTSVDTVK